MSEMSEISIPPVIPYEGDDAPLHTPENGYRCADLTCPCNQPQGRIAQMLAESVRTEIMRADTSGLELL